MAEKRKPTFVWVEGLRGPTFELWMEDYAKALSPVLQKHELQPEDARLTLEDLAKKYPLVQS